ncbi:MAG: hypothetical protein ABWY82_16540 [Tardiphaga sp.]
MTPLAKLNFRISRLRFQMRGMQADIRLLSNAGLDCSNAAARLSRMQAELLALITAREALACPA